MANDHVKQPLFTNLKKMVQIEPDLLSKSDLYYDKSSYDHLSALGMCVKADNGVLADLAEYFLQIDGVEEKFGGQNFQVLI